MWSKVVLNPAGGQRRIHQKGVWLPLVFSPIATVSELKPTKKQTNPPDVNSSIL